MVFQGGVLSIGAPLERADTAPATVTGAGVNERHAAAQNAAHAAALHFVFA